MSQVEDAAGTESLHEQNLQEELFQPKNGQLFGNEDRQRNGSSEVQTPEIAARQEPLQHAVAPYSLASTLEAGDLGN